MLVALTGMAMAAFLPPEVPETQTIDTLTTVQCLGVVFESEDASIAVTNQDGPGCPTGKYEVQSLAAYSTDLLASDGYTDYTKAVQVDTGNKVEGQSNIETGTSLEYSGDGAIFDESIYETGASTGLKDAGDYTICPFGKAGKAPAFCNEAYVSTNMMVNEANFMSTAGVLSIAKDSLTPATLDYGVTVEGDGVVQVAFDAFDVDARDSSYKPKPSAITVYRERTTAIGQFDMTKLISYESGL